MMKNLKKVVVAIVVGFMMVLTSACTASNSFDAKGYTEGFMALLTKGDKTKLITCGMSENEANELYDSFYTTLETAMTSQLSEFNVSDKTNEKWKEMFNTMLNNVKYEVKEAKETSNGYSVDIDINPIQFTELCNDSEITNQVQEKLVEAYNNKEIDDDSMYDFAFYEMAELIIKKLDDPAYGETTAITVVYEKDQDGNYAMKDDYKTGENIGTAMFK